MSRERIFVGGFGGSGTRVIQMILERAGYNIGPTNAFYDWQGADSVPHFDAWYFEKSAALRSFLLKEVPEKSFAVKVGHFMYCIPQLKEWFPGCKFIYMFRNPWDQMSNDNQLHMRYGGLLRRSPLSEKVEYWCAVSREAMAHADLSVSLERLVATPETAIQEILDLAGVEESPARYSDIIERPATMGRAKDSYHLISTLDAPTREWLLGLPGVSDE